MDPTGARAYHGTAVVDFNIYVIGGFDGMDYFNSCRCFNAVNKTWREVGLGRGVAFDMLPTWLLHFFFGVLCGPLRWRR